MAEILKEWLTVRLKRPVNWEAQGFGTMMRNGHTVASLLHSYHVISDENMLLIRQSNDKVDIINNWQYLCKWLEEVDIYLTDNDLNNIMEGVGSASLSLFYQLFLQMDKRERANFIKQKLKTESTLTEKIDNRLNGDKVKKKVKTIADYLNNSLLCEETSHDWQRRKSSVIKESYDLISNKYGNKLEKNKEKNLPGETNTLTPKKYSLSAKEKSDMEQFDLKHPCEYQSYTYEQLLTLNKPKPLIRARVWTKKDMDDLFKRLKKRSDSEKIQNVRKVLKSRTSINLGDEKPNIDTDIAEKTMKLSEYEKQMCTHAMKIKQQARDLVKNKIEAEKLFAKQREKQFNQYLDNLNNQIQVVENRFRKKMQNSFPQ